MLKAYGENVKDRLYIYLFSTLEVPATVLSSEQPVASTLSLDSLGNGKGSSGGLELKDSLPLLTELRPSMRLAAPTEVVL